jgi:chromosome partitioning protein
MKIISFANQKGGVGKTTSVVTLGAGLAQKGWKTLLVDLDPQGHVAFSLGFDKQSGLYQFICLGEPLKKVVITARPNLDILPSDKRTEIVKRQISLSGFRETIIFDHLKNAGYDVILIDLAPSLDVLHLNGLVACDWVVIPTRLDAMALDGVKEILLTLGEIARRGHPFQGYSILPTFFERITRETLTQMKELVQAFSSHVWPPIPQDTRAREAAAYGKTLWEYSPNTSAIRGYGEKHQALGGYQQILERIEEVING